MFKLLQHLFLILCDSVARISSYVLHTNYCHSITQMLNFFGEFMAVAVAIVIDSIFTNARVIINQNMPLRHSIFEMIVSSRDNFLFKRKISLWLWACQVYSSVHHLLKKKLSLCQLTVILKLKNFVTRENTAKELYCFLWIAGKIHILKYYHLNSAKLLNHKSWGWYYKNTISIEYIKLN